MHGIGDQMAITINRENKVCKQYAFATHCSPHAQLASRAGHPPGSIQSDCPS